MARRRPLTLALIESIRGHSRLDMGALRRNARRRAYKGAVNLTARFLYKTTEFGGYFK